MLEFNIPRTEKETATTFPAVLLGRVESWLKRNGVEYKVYTGEHIPDGLPHGYTFRGHKSLIGCACVVAKLDSEAFHATVEHMWDYRPEEI